MSAIDPEILASVTSILAESRATEDEPALSADADGEQAEQPVDGDQATEGAEQEETAEPAPEPEKPLTASERAKHAQALRDAERALAAEAKLKKQLEAVQAELESAKAAKPKQLTKEEFEKLATLYSEGKFPESEEKPEPELTHEQKTIKDLQARLEAIEIEKRQAAEKKQHEDNLAALASYVAEDSALHGLNWVPEKLLERYRDAEKKGETPDPEKIAKEFESSYVSDVVGLLLLPNMRKAVLADERLKNLLAATSGATTADAQPDNPSGNVTQIAAAPKKGPTAITRKAAAERPAQRQTENLTEEQRTAAAIAEVKRIRGY